MALKDAPEKLQPYIFHGVQIDYRGNREPTGTCPFCDRDEKFHISRETGLYNCKLGSCEAKGNVYDFIRRLHELSVEECTEKWLADFAIQRGISVDFLKAWGIAPSYLTGEVVVPAFNIKGKLTNLYHWLPRADTGKKILYSTPTLRHGIFGMWNWDQSKKNVVIAEGPWTGAAVHQIFSGVACKGDLLDGGNVIPMFRRDNSLESEWNVIGIPGCNNFRDVWSELFADLNVMIMLDNDYSTNGKAGAGWKGTVRTAKILLESDHNPARIHGIRWGGKGHTEDFKDGYDMRDALIDHSKDGETLVKAPKAACNALKSVLGYLTPLEKSQPRSDSNGSNGQHEGTPKKKGIPQELAPAYCESYKEVRNAWRKAFKWTDQLDTTLAMMLATAASTSLPGSAQVWMRIIGPPGCLDADTPIYDPVDGTTLTVEERCKLGDKFFVYSMKEEGLSICQALPPVKFAATSMYEVTFSSGERITVSAGHRFWNGLSYASLQSISDEMLLSGAYHLPSISGTDLSTQLQDVHRSLQTVPDSQSCCRPSPCSCDGQPPQVSSIVLDVPPLQDDVQEHNRENLLLGDLDLTSRHTYHCLLSGLPSKHCCFLHIGAQEDEVLHSSTLDTYELLHCSFPLGGSTELSISLTDTGQRVSVSCPPSKSLYEELPLLHGEHRKQSYSPISSFSHNALLNSLEHIDELSLPFYQQPQDDDASGEALRSPYGDISTPSLVPSASTSCTLLENVPPGNTEQLSRGPLLSQPDSSFSSIRLSRIGSVPYTLTESVQVVNIEYVGEREYYDFHVPETRNYWACGTFHHNSGKSSFCEALSVSGKYVFPVSTQKGFHSGAKDKDGNPCSLIPHMQNKTIIIKDGDTLLNGPNRDQSLAELRDLYDGTSRARYRNSNESQNYTGLRITFLLAGTKSLKRMNRSFLGDRFLDCVIYEKGDDPVLEANILKRSAYNALRQTKMDDESVDSINDERMINAMSITAGYLHYLRDNIDTLANEVTVSEQRLDECIALGELTSYMRARPDKELEEEDDEVELATRLTAQYVRLAICSTVVYNHQDVDDTVMKSIKKVASDTCRGITFNISKKLAQYPAGLEPKTLSGLLHHPTQRINAACRFLAGIGVVTKAKRAKSNLWLLDERVSGLFELIED